MNIAIVTTWFPAGAGYVSKAYKEILEKEHNVFIYARGGKVMKGDPEWDLQNVTWAPRHYNGIKTSHLIKWAKKNKIEIIFFNEQRYWKPVVEAKKAGFYIGSYIDYYTKETVPAFGIYDFLICNTKRHYSVFKWHKNCYYIPWGTDINKFKPKEFKKNRLLTFINSAGWQGAGDADRRGTLLAMEAFTKVKGECRLLIYSQLELKKCNKKWQEMVAKDKRIIFIEGTFDPFPYNTGDVFVYPSRLDGIGLTLPEALSSGLPSITTDTAPMNEFVIDDLNGSLVNVKKKICRQDGYYWPESICDINSLSEKMQKYFNSDVLLRESSLARENAVKNLNWTLNASRLPEIFYKITNTKQFLNKDLEQLIERIDNKISPTTFYLIKQAVRKHFYYMTIKNKKS